MFQEEHLLGCPKRWQRWLKLQGVLVATRERGLLLALPSCSPAANADLQAGEQVLAPKEDARRGFNKRPIQLRLISCLSPNN